MPKHHCRGQRRNEQNPEGKIRETGQMLVWIIERENNSQMEYKIRCLQKASM